MTDGMPAGEDFEALFSRWHRLEEIRSLGVGSSDVQRHLRLTMEDLENRMLVMDPRRKVAVTAHHAATRPRRAA